MPPLAFVGRDAALDELRAAVAAGVAGGAAVVLIGGEPGIGKTRLVSELQAGCPCPVLVGHADPDAGAPPLWPWHRALAGRPERAALTGIGSPGIGSPGIGSPGIGSPGIGSPVPRTADPGTATMLARAALTLAFDAVLDGLVAAAVGGLVVVLEDLHWADESTLRLLVLGAGRPGLVLVGTYRPTEQGPALRSALTALRRHDRTRTVTLQPLTGDDVTLLLPARTHPSWAAVLHRAGAGNPLVTGALLTTLTDTGRDTAPAPADGSWPLGVPDDLADATAERLARLVPGARFAVEVASVTGPGCTPDHLLQCGDGQQPADYTDALTGLESAARAGLLQPTDPGCFDLGHVLLREAVYGRLPAARRLRWHTRLAEGIESGALPGDPVTHRLRSATDVPGRAAAARACRTAAAVAAAALDFGRAAELLDAALALPALDPADRTELLLEAAEAEYAAGLPDPAVRRARQVAVAGADPAHLVRAALIVRGINGPHNVELVDLCDVALRALDPDDDAGRARLLAQRALARADSVGWEEVDDASTEALRLAEASGSPEALADALRARQHAVSGPGGVAERLDIARRMIALADHGGPADAELWGRLWRIDAAMQLGSLDVLDTELRHLGRFAERLGWPIAAWHHHRLLAARHLLTGRFDAADAEADLALAAARRTGDVTALVLDVAFRYEGWRLRGHYGELVQRLHGAEATVHGPGIPIFWAQAGIGMFEAGEPDIAQRYLDLLRPIVDRLPPDGMWLPTVLSTGELATMLGDDAVVEHCLGRTTPYAADYIAGGSGSLRCDGSVSRVLGILAAALGRDDEARRRLTDAVTMEDRIGALPYRVLSEIALARVLARRPDERARAAGLARRAADTARRIGMAPALAAADELSATIRHEQRCGVALTGREREVLARLAGGRTNRQIAAELVLSERTVETHVGNVLGKLGVANRAEAAVWASRQGYAST